MKNFLTILIVAVNISCNRSVVKSDTIINDVTGCNKTYIVDIFEITKEAFDVVPSYIGLHGEAKDSASTNGKQVIIRTQNRDIAFNNIDPAVDTIHPDEYKAIYQNLGYNHKLDKYLIYSDLYEGDIYMLLDNTTNRIDTLSAYPIFSPGRERVITADTNPYSEMEINGEFVTAGDIVIYALCNKSLKRIYERSFGFIPLEVKWIDENTVIMKRKSSLDDKLNIKDRKYRFYKFAISERIN